MDVHHHPVAIGSHTERRKWTHYFWEFLMLFLALNMLQLYLIIIQTTGINQYDKYATLNHTLLEELRKQYHLK